MRFLSALGELACIAIIAFCVWRVISCLCDAYNDLGPICASIGGGCQ
jgi:hypothetical protein